mmetsp:Transcript_50620/g.134791  ORF Transcript_50620/g.134791 Transcript_50620/m.134791 type:complete len:227 (-) Transcript_50620:298-978(-)|eukprot:CAMPEP_0194491222 /NCGR_PEP_ID=MMETSP0253-20130528/10168_1 /TAXON_ID=2966 /ORGANISM="Noctiluca scintillans" /LENGTH=226 /DNA_ID=CAMNT_0039331933 /DNA_START=744 /DNA_END=1424 /DNA_ORIENTATION=+
MAAEETFNAGSSLRTPKRRLLCQLRARAVAVCVETKFTNANPLPFPVTKQQGMYAKSYSPLKPLASSSSNKARCVISSGRFRIITDVPRSGAALESDAAPLGDTWPAFGDWFIFGASWLKVRDTSWRGREGSEHDPTEREVSESRCFEFFLELDSLPVPVLSDLSLGTTKAARFSMRPVRSITQAVPTSIGHMLRSKTGRKKLEWRELSASSDPVSGQERASWSES